ncbi:MAG: dTDP-4-dehydrorhamnose 3,5-epimerase [Rhodospirillales bacterium]|jgi:dTDP-4-dehydrorhamnose 3,5-epimerase|nr:dTDP-4-dehydrorhamnose 3,5-epimerase [Rhodospirillales bacterium]
MDVKPTQIEGVKLLTPIRHQDARGAFSEIYNAERFREAGISCEFVQDNLSLSRLQGTVRGLHFQAPPHSQDKLVRVVRGAVLDVIVDIRAASSTYGRHEAFRLDATAGTQLFVPKGFLHGFCTLEPDTEVVYKVSAFYAPKADFSVLWNDPDLGIEWPVLPAEAILSPKDAAAPRLRDVPRFF